MTSNELVFKQWKQKRYITTVLAMIQAFLIGVEYSAISVSALFYLKDLLHAKNADFFYGLTIGAMYISSISSGIFLGRYTDKVRNPRGIVLSTGMLSIFGNLMYSLPYSPWLLVTGRFFCGFGDAVQAVVSGKLNSYLYQELEY